MLFSTELRIPRSEIQNVNNLMPIMTLFNRCMYACYRNVGCMRWIWMRVGQYFWLCGKAFMVTTKSCSECEMRDSSLSAIEVTCYKLWICASTPDETWCNILQSTKEYSIFSSACGPDKISPHELIKVSPTLRPWPSGEACACLPPVGKHILLREGPHSDITEGLSLVSPMSHSDRFI
jgi:hypothetical protein